MVYAPLTPSLRRRSDGRARTAGLAAVLGVLLGAPGCGRFGFDPLGEPRGPGDGGDLGDAARDGFADAPDDAGGDAPCTAQFSAPMRLGGGFNTVEKDWAPVISADDTTLYFHSYRDGGSGPPDLWSAVRPIGGVFGAPQILAASSLAADLFPRVTADHLELFQSSARMGGQGMADVWVSTRAAITEPFGPALALTALNSSAADEALTITGDGLDAVFASSRGAGFDLYRSRRTDRASPFGPPVALGELNTGDDERAPFLSPDGLTLYFSSDRPGGAGNLDVWTAARPTVDDPFGAPINIAMINSSRDDYAPSISADGLTLYYSYDVPIVGGAGDPDVWIATRVCTP